MRVTGIIAEYNPFHSGHKYHIARAKELAGADFCAVAMSGDFVQRGEPAVYSKYARARAALACGADLVLEIPSVFATGSAEDFASCGVALLSGLGAVDSLCFGSECGDAGLLMEAARYLSEEPEDYAAFLREGVKNGLTWPQARSSALRQANALGKEALIALESPNNLLGIEYCRAILRQSSPLKPLTVLRQGNGYHDERLEGGQASASALRKALAAGVGLTDPANAFGGGLPPIFSHHVPQEALDIFSKSRPMFPDDFSSVLNFALAERLRDGRGLSDCEGMNIDLERRMERLLIPPETWEGRIRQLKTRQYTYTRISRALLHVLLGVTAEKTAAGRASGYCPYARVLGFRREAAPLLGAIKRQGAIPLITKTADAASQLSGTALDLLKQDFYSSHLWQSVYFGKYGEALKNEYNQEIAVL